MKTKVIDTKYTIADVMPRAYLIFASVGIICFLGGIGFLQYNRRVLGFVLFGLVSIWVTVMLPEFWPRIWSAYVKWRLRIFWNNREYISIHRAHLPILDDGMFDGEMVTFIISAENTSQTYHFVKFANPGDDVLFNLATQ